MTLSTQKEGVTSSIPFDQTEYEGILTPEDTINILTTLKEISQSQIPPSFRNLPKPSVNPPAPSYHTAKNLTYKLVWSQSQYPHGEISTQSTVPIFYP
ncbi:hypothetical protein DSO57_1005926 [Entomophthora muscae]|uniref:Uncharacterized protein n=1 Tax=Entomophthora muscae TaxID=34485 RepID=A0ACC2RYU8_9FUNG|nr:hypothetical protein DSO57_1005926 [Entomophthora muscae]